MVEGDGGEPSRVGPSYEAAGRQQRFSVELRPGETTIVSWKKLLKDATKAKGSATLAPEPPSNAHPALESRIAPAQPPETEVQDAPPASRFSAVIEKIERLYVGKNSSDEEDLNDVPDDDEYDTEDSFIDDTELDEYFQVDNSTIKHDGFFVNRGMLERLEPTSSQIQQPKKRRRKDMGKSLGGNEDENAPNKVVKVGKKAIAKSVPSSGKNSDSSYTMPITNAQSELVKFQDQVNASQLSSRKKSGEAKTTLDQSSLQVSNGDAAGEEKDKDKQKVGLLASKNHSTRLKEGSELFDASIQRGSDRSSIVQSKVQSGVVSNNFAELSHAAPRAGKDGVTELPYINVTEGKNPVQNVKVPLMQRKEGSSVKQKGSALEKAIRELEKLVAESRPPAMEVSDADISSQAVKKRLSPEIKLKLARVARLAQSSHGKISKELINRLMSIVGHLMQLRTLKRNLKVMVNTGLSAKREHEDRLQQIKKEVADMVKMRIPLMKSKTPELLAGASDDFQEVPTEGKEAMKKKYSMDDALEEKICDLYDFFIDGLDEDAGPPVRKLYAELAALWPSGCMDNHGIKRAICRAKDRRRARHNRHKEQEKMRRKKMVVPKMEDTTRIESTSIIHGLFSPEKSVPDTTSSSHALNAFNRQQIGSNTTSSSAPAASAGNTTTSGATFAHVNVNGAKHEKQQLKQSSLDGLVKKKIKRKPEVDERNKSASSVHVEDRNKSQKQVAAPSFTQLSSQI